MIKSWDDFAWEDYLYWQTQDKKTLKRINQLLQDIDRNGHAGIGKPEPSKITCKATGATGLMMSTVLSTTSLMVGLRFFNI